MPAFKWWTETRSLVASLSFCLVAVSGGSALAVPEDACIKDEKCKDHYSKGVKLYKEENFDEALTEFQAAVLLARFRGLADGALFAFGEVALEEFAFDLHL